MKNIIRLILCVSVFLNISISSAQRIEYNLVDKPIERSQIEIGKRSTFLISNLHDRVYWYHAIEPRWINVAGLIIADEITEVFRDDFSDGKLTYAYFYQSSISQDEYIIAAVHAFDDGLSSYHLFHYLGESVTYLGELAFFSMIPNHPMMGGFHNSYPKDKLKILRESDNFIMEFDSGRYSYRHHYQDYEHYGPLSFKIESDTIQLIE